MTRMRLEGKKSRMENRNEQKDRSRERVPNPTTLDPSVISYDSQGSYDEPILPHPMPHRGVIYNSSDEFK